ncbi:MAG TPA: ATP-binding protein, partial [Clostridia bacterium]|nr:ATP-binding protein [Clostridia bacterium]
AQTLRDTSAKLHVQRPLPKVRANPGVLKEALVQLLSNALKFVPAGVTPNIRIWAEGEETIRLWFEDNGIGIPAQYHDRVFHVFERLHGTEDYQGTGIGLSIVQRGIERMDGRVGMESEPGKGSRFWIELPRASSDPQEEEKQ